jgi:hypothetical protein
MPADEAEAKTAVLDEEQLVDEEDRYSPRASDAGVSVLEREFLPFGSHGVQIPSSTNQLLIRKQIWDVKEKHEYSWATIGTATIKNVYSLQLNFIFRGEYMLGFFFKVGQSIFKDEIGWIIFVRQSCLF